MFLKKSASLVVLTMPILFFSSNTFAKTWYCEWSYDCSKKQTTFYRVDIEGNNTDVAAATCVEFAARELLKAKKSDVCVWFESSDPNEAALGYQVLTFFQANLKYSGKKSTLPPLKITVY